MVSQLLSDWLKQPNFSSDCNIWVKETTQQLNFSLCALSETNESSFWLASQTQSAVQTSAKLFTTQK